MHIIYSFNYVSSWFRVPTLNYIFKCINALTLISSAVPPHDSLISKLYCPLVRHLCTVDSYSANVVSSVWIREIGVRRLMDIQKVFAGNVRKHRKAAKLSQEKLAELAGLHRTYIGGIEQRRVNVSLKNIGKIADALGVDPAVLFLADSDGAESGARKIGASRFKPLTDARNLESASKQADPSDYALCAWHDGKLTMRPIDVAYEDLTVQIVNDLVMKGYRGSDLAAQYSAIHYEVVSFLES